MDHSLGLEDDRGGWSLRPLMDKRVVTIGGGTGPFALLSRLKQYPCTTTAIVTMADSGGSSRRLMDEFGRLPLGDLRQALVALSRKGMLWRDVFTFRFPKGQQVRETAATHAVGAALDAVAASVAQTKGTARGGAAHEARGQVAVAAVSGGVSGHSLGNLIIAALQTINDGNLLQAIEDAQELLDTAGKVLPVTLAHTTLCAELANGQVMCGETEIDTRGEGHPEPLVPIRRVFLREHTPPCDEAIRAIKRADVIVIGPGDLYTSVIPNLLVDRVAQAIRTSEAQKVYVCNLMTKHGETDGFRASDFVREIHRYLGDHVNRVILHDGSFPAHLLGRYAARQQHPVEADVEAVRRLAPMVVIKDQLLAIHREQFIRHDADRLIGAMVLRLAVELSGVSAARAGHTSSRMHA